MKKVKCLFFTFAWVLLLCVACCATKPKQVEAVISAENPADETVAGETIVAESIDTTTVVAERNAKESFDPEGFIRELTGMEVVTIFPDQKFEYTIELRGKTVSGRQYFEYTSPLYPKPISSADEMFAMFNHQALIARQFNPGYVVNLAMNISNSESVELGQKKLTLNVPSGIRIHDYRREGTLKYTVKDAEGKLRYGEYVIVSAVVTQNETEADAYNALQELLKQTETTDITDLFVKLFAKKMTEKSKGADHED